MDEKELKDWQRDIIREVMLLQSLSAELSKGIAKLWLKIDEKLNGEKGDKT